MKEIAIILIYFAIAISITLLVGCSTPTSVAVPVQVPIAVHCPSPLIPPKPYVPAQDLKIGDSSDKAVKAWVVSFKIYRDYADELRTILEGYQ